MKNTEILFRGMSNRPSDHACANGEMEVLAGAIYEDNMIKPLREGSINWTQAANGLTPSTRKLGIADAFPQLVFGMESAGHVALSHSFELPKALVPSASSGGNGSGQATVHPMASSTSTAQAATSACNAVNMAIENAIQGQVHAKGLFYQPSFVRYALRMNDGSLVLPSAPVLMLPNVLPPCLAIDTAQDSDDDKCIVQFSSTSFKKFKLRCKIAKPLPSERRSEVRAIEIFLSLPVYTYDSENPTNTGFATYSSSLASLNTGISLRGRATDDDIFVGRWSEGADNYRDWFLADLPYANSIAWEFAPNQSMMAELALVEDFYHVATINTESALEATDFFDLDIIYSDPKALKKNAKFAASAQTHSTLSPAALINCGESLWAGGGIEAHAAPLPLPTLLSASQNLSEGSSRIRVISWHEGTECATEIKETSDAPAIPTDFPRYLWHPDSNAHEMQIWQGEECWSFPLRRCPSGEGAFWLGPLTALSPQDFLSERDQRILPASTPCPSAIFKGTEYDMRKVGSTEGELLSMQCALRAMSSGQFGQYPLYAFTSEGIWAIQRDGSGEQLSRERIAVQAVEPTEQGVAFLSPRGLMHIVGAKAECLSETLCPQPPIQLDKLPKFAETAGLNSLPSLSQIMEGATLRYDSQNGRLWIINFALATCYAYSLSGKTWAIALLSGNAPAQDGRCIMVTRPLKLTHPLERVRMHSMRMLGNLTNAIGATILYGSNDLRKWRIVGSTYGACISCIAGSGYRYYKIAIDARLPEGESIDGVLVAYREG